jgi:dihydrofolate reductase
VSKVIWHITMSLDGFISGPDDSMDWAFGHGEHSHIADDTLNEIGAIVEGRNWYELRTPDRQPIWSFG